MRLHYRNIACSRLSDSEIALSASLFSNHYGKWASSSPIRPGEQICMTVGMFHKMYIDKPDRFVALMYDDDRLIGQAIYIRRKSPWHSSDRYVTFVLQLVVDKNYRGCRLGLRLLQSIFGLSNDDACGLYTSNPLTIRALEDATFRHIEVNRVANKLQSGLREVLADVFDSNEWLDSFRNGCVNTKFFADHTENGRKRKNAYPNGGFPFKEDLRDGEEWLAMVFKDQKVDANVENIKKLTETSWTILKDAYSRMRMVTHSWARYADQEVDYLFRNGFVKEGDRVLDIGCGTGRHAIELAKRGCIVHGIDFSSAQLEIARKDAEGVEGVSFEEADALNYRASKKYDVVLCLYDVIGSSIEYEDARRVVKAMSHSLKRRGLVVVSVMNLELTVALCRRANNQFAIMNETDGFSKLMQLPSSNTMQSSGDIFKGQLILLNPNTGVAYRREQFFGESELPTEYIVSDRRFSGDGLRKLFADYNECDVRYVSAGRWESPLRPTEKHAKEVLGVFRKRGWM